MSRRAQTADERDVVNLESGLDALQSSPEFRGPVESLDGHASNDHLALIYESRAEQFAAAVPFVRQGLERGERCLYIADENSKAEVLDAMRSAGVDVDAALDSGALTVHTAQDTYLRNGAFDPDDMISFLGDAIADAGEEYEALRVTGEMTWVLGDEPRVEDLIEYEAKLNRLLPGEDAIALCQYNRERFPADVLRDVINTHPYLIHDNTVCHNFYYTPPEKFLGPDRPAREVDQMMRTLVDRTEAKAKLQERERYLREQNDITASPDRSFEEKLRALFDLGKERFDLELGALARVDADADRFEVEYVSDDHEHFEPGVELPLSETYCTAATEIKAAGSVSDPRAEGYDDITVYQEFGIRAYLGTYVAVDGDDDRTFFFVSSEERETAFTDEELAFQRLMGRWVKYELERQGHERHQQALYEIAADTDRSFDEKLRALFDLGKECFDLELGGIARVDPATDLFEVERVSDDHEHLQPGARVALSETYCRIIGDGAETASVSDPVGRGFEGTVAYEEFGVKAYLGTHVAVDGDDDRTFFFVSSEERETAFTDEERTFHRLMGQWVKYELERQRREDRLSALNALSRRLMDAETAAGVSERVTEAAAERLGVSVAAIGLYDDRAGDLRRAAATDDAAGLLQAASPFAVGDSVGWDAFVAGESKRASDPPDGRGANAHPRVTEVAALPLGDHGVFVAGSAAEDGFSSAELDFVETVAATTGAALDRSHREQQLHEREATLEDQNETLERLDRVNTIIRSIDRALVGASTRSEMEAVVCRHLVDDGPYDLAWIGTHDPVNNQSEPKEWAGAPEGRLDELAAADDGEEAPPDRVIRTWEPEVVNNMLGDPPFEPWRQAALDRGYHASISLPLTYGDSLYGVLNVYAGQPNVFDDLERTVLAELSDNIAHAINAVENKKALVGDEVTELEFAVPDADYGVAELVRETGCEFVHESTVSQTGGGLRDFFYTRGVDSATVHEFAPRMEVTDLDLLSEREEDGEPVCLFEAELADDSLPAAVLERDGRIHRIRAADDAAAVTVHLDADADVREFVTMLQRQYAGAELVAQRTRERPKQTLVEFRAALTDDLTPRQREALQTAYFSGYFERPRTRTGSEIADAMDISQPTFHHHLRAAQRKLCRTLLREESLAE